MVPRRAFFLLSFAVSLANGLAAPAAFAQTGAVPPAPAPSSAPLADTLHGPAKEAYTAAKVLFVNNDFQGALTKFQQAYDLSKDARLLSNMAVCEKNLHHYARTKALLEQYQRQAGGRMTADERASIAAALEAIRSLVGTVKLTVAQDGTAVLLDGVTIGTTPLALPVPVDLGTHVLTLRKTGFDPIEKAVDVAGGNSIDVAFALTASLHVATLTISTDEAAAVAIDGVVVGSGHFRDKVSAGAHTVRVTEKGKLAFESELELHDGETRTLEVTLQDERHTPVWPWIVGGGAVLVGGGVAAYFIFKPTTNLGAPPPGHLGSGEVQLNSARRGR